MPDGITTCNALMSTRLGLRSQCAVQEKAAKNVIKQLQCAVNGCGSSLWLDMHMHMHMQVRV